MRNMPRRKGSKNEQRDKDGLSTRQRIYLDIYADNVGMRLGKTKQQMLIEAGYSKEQAFQQTNILAALQPHIQKLNKRLEDKLQEKIDLAVQHLTEEKLKDGNIRDLVDTVDKLLKDKRLLEEKSTEIMGIQQIRWADDHDED